MSFIEAKNLKHHFVRRNEQGEVIDTIPALSGVDLNVEKGQFIAILGPNGCGKSTLAKHLNRLLIPHDGTLWVGGYDAAEEDNELAIRQNTGMIFQNPDNQIVADVVEEDVAFGPENLGIATEEIWERVADSLEAVGMTAYRYHSPNRLSGGQKQRIAIAGVVAMRPECIIMDESTAMLDPVGRQEVLKTVHMLNREMGVTILLITHYMEEALDADRVFVMDEGQVVLNGTPKEIFTDVNFLKAHRLDVPQIIELFHELREEGIAVPDGALNSSDVISFFRERMGKRTGAFEESASKKQAEKSENDSPRTSTAEKSESRKIKLSVENIDYVYNANTSYAVQALEAVSFRIMEGEYVGIIGHTGSGKSTLIQMLNGLLKPTKGLVAYEGQNLYENDFSLRSLRQKVGLVFQYPEYQLFEVTVLKDVCFGPKNQGLPEEEALDRAKEALNLVQLPSEQWEMSPFELSGGQKRRAAIAGILAMKPEVLILDEPTAGLDPNGKNELFALIDDLRRQTGMTILLVTHSMEDAANYVDRLLVMRQGKLWLDDTPEQIFSREKELKEAGLTVPQITAFMNELADAGIPVDRRIYTVEDAKKEILRLC